MALVVLTALVVLGLPLIVRFPPMLRQAWGAAT